MADWGCLFLYAHFTGGGKLNLPHREAVCGGVSDELFSFLIFCIYSCFVSQRRYPIRVCICFHSRFAGHGPRQ